LSVFGAAGAAGRSTGVPTVSGVARFGQTLTCNAGAQTGSAPPSYTWLWDQTVSLAPFTLKPGTPLFGLQASVAASSSFFTHPSASTYSQLVQVGTGPTLTVPDLPSGGSLLCTIDGHIVGQPASGPTLSSRLRESSPLPIAFPGVAPALVTQQRFPNGKITILPGPQITAGIGVGAVNTCAPGTWLHYPTFSYAWYSLGGRIAGQIARSRTLLARGQTLTIVPAYEKVDLECVVTATNTTGSSQAGTNDYVVPVNPPVALEQPSVSIETQEPSSTPGLAGPNGAQAIAEQVDLTCQNGKWNRSDLHFQTQWVEVDQNDNPTDWLSGAGSPSLDFDMRPGNAQYTISVECLVVATTSNGAKAVSLSGPISVWNGCDEVAAGSSSPNPAFLDSAPVADGVQISGLIAVPLTAVVAIVGGVAVVGDIVPVATTAANDILSFFGSQPTINTYGPNCGDYQKYWMGQGYTVKQQQGDPP
jgi:hypothetical protein